MTVPLRDEPMPGQPVRWRGLSASEAEDYWQELDGWVCWWVEREGIPVRVVPPCWYKHGRLVEELTALERAYVTYTEAASPGSGLVVLRSQVELTRTRLAEHTRTLGCDALEHREETPVEWVSDNEAGIARRAWFDQDVARREAEEDAAG